jgi:hypothetical protein
MYLQKETTVPGNTTLRIRWKYCTPVQNSDWLIAIVTGEKTLRGRDISELVRIHVFDFYSNVVIMRMFKC